MSRPRDGIRRGPLPLASSIERLQKDLGIPARSTATTLEAVVRDVLGPLIDQLTAIRMRSGVLVLDVNDPAVAEAVRFRARAIVDALAAADPPVVCERVDVRVDRRGAAR